MGTSKDPTSNRRARRFPAFGVLLGVLTLLVECWAIKGLIKTPGSFSPADLLVALAVSVMLFGALDFLLQFILPGMGLALVPRAALVVVLGYGLTRLIQVPVFLGLWCAAAVWSLAQIYCASLWGRFLPFRWVTLATVAAVAVHLLAVSTQPPVDSDPPPSAEPASGPSFLVVVLDTVRADHTSTYGYGRETTPALDRLAARGTRFERAYSTASWTIPAHGSLFTGMLPEQHGTHAENFVLMRDVPTLAGLLAFHGYETTAFCASPMVTAKTGMTRGFQHVEEFWKPNLIRLSLSGCRTFQRLCPTNRDKGGADLVARAVEWLRSRDSSLPYFMFVNLFEAHAPYQAVPERFRRAFVAPGVSLRQLEIVGTRGYLAQWSGDEFPRRYDQHLTDLLDGAISAADSSLSQLADAAGDDVVLIVLSDHGDLIGEHDYHGHGHVLWEPLIRIPLVLAGPGIPSGAVVDEPVSIIDVMPTILEMADIPTDHLTGTDLRRVLTNDGETGRILYAQQFLDSGLTARGWGRNRSAATIRNLESRKTAGVLGPLKRIVMGDGTDLTFDLISDPEELHPILAPEAAPAVRPPRPTTRHNTRFDLKPDAEAALRALGYIR